MGCGCRGSKVKKAAAETPAKPAEPVQSRPASKKSADPRSIIIGMRYNTGK